VRCVCDERDKASRKNRGLFSCACGWTEQADVNGAINLLKRAFAIDVPSVKGGSGRKTRPVVLSFRADWHTVHAVLSPAVKGHAA